MANAFPIPDDAPVIQMVLFSKPLIRISFLLCLLRPLSLFFINAELKPLCSISFKPAIVHPLGEVTLSISSSGWNYSQAKSAAAPLAV